MSQRHVRCGRAEAGVRRPVRRLPPIELLESRIHLSLSLQGTPGDDSFIVSVESDNRVQLNFNGAIEVFDGPADGFVEILGFGGNDDIWLQNTNDLQFYITGHDGDDSYTIGNGQLELDIEENVTVVEQPAQPGQGGNDQLLFNDSLGFNGGSAIVIRDGRLLLPSTLALPLIDFNLTPEDQVTLQGSTGGDEYFVEGLRPNMTFNMGAGNDTASFGGGQNRLDYAIPSNVSFDGGTGTDEINLTDVHPSSATTSILVDENALLGGIEVRNFDEMWVNTGTQSGGPVKPVVFTGDISPAYAVTIQGGQGPDEVHIGTLSDRVDADDFADHFTLQLSGGVNKVEIHNQFGNGVSGQGWIFKDTGLESSTGQMSLSSNTSLSIVLRGTFGPDTFTVFDAPDDWNIDVEGSQGDDLLQMGPTLDLDDVFDGFSFDFIGGSGDDTLSLSDIHDQLGDFDEYEITDEFIKKGDPGVVSFSFISTDFISHLIFVADNDPNSIIYDVNSYRVAEIYGADGADTFINKASGLVPSDFLIHSLAPQTRLFGDAGADILTIDDSSGGLANYEMNAGVFLYLPDTRTFRIDYDSFQTIDFLASNQPSTISVRSTPASAQVTVQGRGGDDEFIVGGGDIDASGISSSNTTLLAGSGNDRITFDDGLDDHGLPDDDTFSFHFQQVIKDGTTIVYGGFESQKLITSGVNSSGVTFPNKVRVNAIDIPTEIEGAAGVRDNTVDVGNFGIGLSQIFAPVTLSFDNALVVASVNDQTALADRIYAFSATQMYLPVVVNYSGVEEMFIYAGSGHDELSVSGSPAGMTIFFNGGNGDEIMALGTGGGSFADLAGRVFANGGNGIDQLFIINGVAGGFTHGVLTSGGFTANGGPIHLYSATELLEVRVNDAGSSIDVQSSATARIQGANGDDSVTIGGGDFNDNVHSVMVLGEGGFDRVVIDDANDVNPPATAVDYRFDVAFGLDRFLKTTDGFAQGVQCIAVEQRQFKGSNDPNQINVLDTQGELRIDSGGGSDAIAVTDATGLVSVDTGSGADQLTINTDSGSAGDPPLTVRFDRSDDLNTLDLHPGGTLDLADHDLILNYSSVSPVGIWTGSEYDGLTGHIAAGRIFSSSAIGQLKKLGVAEAREALGITGTETATFADQSVDSTAVLIKFTWGGDANLDGKINIDDYGRIDGNVAQSGVVFGWFNGDFNLDGKINIDDYGIIDGNINQQDEIL